MPNNWVQALKIYNKGKNEWCIPKKGGKEYEEIKKIMNGETIIITTLPKQNKQTKQPKASKELIQPIELIQQKAPKETQSKTTKLIIDNTEDIKKYKILLADTLFQFLEINSLYSYDDLLKYREMNEEFNTLYIDIEGAFFIYASFKFNNVDEIKLLIDKYKTKKERYEYLLKTLKRPKDRRH